MEISYIKIIESFIVVGIYILIKIASNKVIYKTLINNPIQQSRGRIVRKAINLTLLFKTL